MIFRRRLHPANLGVHPADRRLVTIGATGGFRRTIIERMKKILVACSLVGIFYTVSLFAADALANYRDIRIGLGVDNYLDKFSRATAEAARKAHPKPRSPNYV